MRVECELGCRQGKAGFFLSFFYIEVSWVDERVCLFVRLSFLSQLQGIHPSTSFINSRRLQRVILTLTLTLTLKQEIRKVGAESKMFSYRFLLTVGLAAVATVVCAKDIDIDVGEEGIKFEPNTTTADVGDV